MTNVICFFLLPPPKRLQNTWEISEYAPMVPIFMALGNGSIWVRPKGLHELIPRLILLDRFCGSGRSLKRIPREDIGTCLAHRGERHMPTTRNSGATCEVKEVDFTCEAHSTQASLCQTTFFIPDPRSDHQHTKLIRLDHSHLSGTLCLAASPKCGDCSSAIFHSTFHFYPYLYIFF